MKYYREPLERVLRRFSVRLRFLTQAALPAEMWRAEERSGEIAGGRRRTLKRRRTR